VSNYLFVAGNSKPVNTIQQHFQSKHGTSDDDLSFDKITGDKSIFVIERNNQKAKSSFYPLGKEGALFFRGQAIDHSTKSLILGGAGFSNFVTDNPTLCNPNKITDFEGSYVLARWNRTELTFENDLFSIYRVICYFTDEVAIISDSLVLIIECVKSMGISPEINRNVAEIKAWNASGFPNAPVSQELILEGAFTLQAGAFLKLKWNKKGISPTIVNRNVKQVFEYPDTNYSSALKICANHMYSSIEMIAKLFDPVIEFGLSGGLDSRLILALCLKSPEIMKCLKITTNKSPARRNDYSVVENLSQKYNFSFNQTPTESLKEITRKNRVRISNKFGFWCLSSIGTYDSFYLTPHYSMFPCSISMLGVGAEQVKQTSDQSRVHKLASNQSITIREAVRSQVLKSLDLMGVGKESDDAMKWHHMTHKAAYHLGFKIAQSSMILRPYVQKSLFAIAQLSDNPFRGMSIKGPTVIHDLLILLNPQLASEDYDMEHKNIAQEYVDSRLSELGGMISLETAKKPRIYGALQAVNNGPSISFLNVVSNFTIDSNQSIKQQLLMKVERIYQDIMPLDLKELYLSCYENTIRSLNDESIELSYAGSLAARFLVFELFYE
jgi:hypothetical protein